MCQQFKFGSEAMHIHSSFFFFAYNHCSSNDSLRTQNNIRNKFSAIRFANRLHIFHALFSTVFFNYSRTIFIERRMKWICTQFYRFIEIFFPLFYQNIYLLVTRHSTYIHFKHHFAIFFSLYLLLVSNRILNERTEEIFFNQPKDKEKIFLLFANLLIECNEKISHRLPLN